MKKNHVVIWTGILLVTLLLPLQADTGAIDWRSSLDQAVHVAQKSGKNILLVFSSPG